MKAHFVRFLFPGTFVSEEDSQALSAWDVETAKRLATVYLRRPFAFEFTTRERADDELDSKVVATSPRYYIGGEVRTAAEIEAGTDPREDILRSNVKNNGYKRIIYTCGQHFALEDGAVVLPV